MQRRVKVTGLENVPLQDILAIRDGRLVVKGRFTAQLFNPDGSKAWEAPIHFNNAPTNVGLNALLSAFFAGGTQVPTWYIGLVDNAGFSTFAAADTMASHAGWAENTGYSQSTRPAWAPGAVSGQQIASSTATQFTASGSMTIKGAFITSDNTKGGTAGTLWATGAFASLQVISLSGQILEVNYSCSASGS